MNKFIFLFLAIYANFAFGQINQDVKSPLNLAEIPAKFPKGTEVFRKMIADNFRMRKINSIKNLFCEVTFVVEKDGKISEVEAKGNDDNFNKEAIRAVSKIKEKWIPGTVDGQKVRYRYKFPLNITFD